MHHWVLEPQAGVLLRGVALQVLELRRLEIERQPHAAGGRSVGSVPRLALPAPQARRSPIGLLHRCARVASRSSAAVVHKGRRGAGTALPRGSSRARSRPLTGRGGSDPVHPRGFPGVAGRSRWGSKKRMLSTANRNEVPVERSSSGGRSNSRESSLAPTLRKRVGNGTT